jgi:hypothetical protein
MNKSDRRLGVGVKGSPGGLSVEAVYVVAGV